MIIIDGPRRLLLCAIPHTPPPTPHTPHTPYTTSSIHHTPHTPHPSYTPPPYTTPTLLFWSSCVIISSYLVELPTPSLSPHLHPTHHPLTSTTPSLSPHLHPTHHPLTIHHPITITPPSSHPSLSPHLHPTHHPLTIHHPSRSPHLHPLSSTTSTLSPQYPSGYPGRVCGLARWEGEV